VINTNRVALLAALALSLAMTGCQSGKSAAGDAANLAGTRQERAAAAQVAFAEQRDEARRLVALDLWRQGDVAGCAAQLEDLCSRHPADPAIHAHLAELAWSQGDLARAESEYRVALELAPEQPDLHHALALVLLDAGRQEEAQGHLARAAFHEPAGVDLSQPATLPTKTARVD
jgi:Tfp pilus assembly protein PilF